MGAIAPKKKSSHLVSYIQEKNLQYPYYLKWLNTINTRINTQKSTHSFHKVHHWISIQTLLLVSLLILQNNYQPLTATHILIYIIQLFFL